MLPRYRRVWARLKDLLMRLRNWLRGQGFSGMASLFDRFAPQTAEELYERIESGAVGRRPFGYGERAGEGGARYAVGPIDMERAEVSVHPKLFAKLGVPERGVRANYVNLARKHPEYFASPEDAQQHVERVLSDPTFALPNLTHPWHVSLVRANGRDQLVAVRFELGRGRREYSVRSAYLMDEGSSNGSLMRSDVRAGLLSCCRSLGYPRLPCRLHLRHLTVTLRRIA
jgi:hypothetical protein